MELKKLYELQRIGNSSFDDVDKIAYSICEAFNLPKEKVDNFTAKQFDKYSHKLTKLLYKQSRKTWFKPKYVTDATKITAGQFVEIQHFISNDMGTNIHKIAASLKICKNKNHKKLSEKILNKSARYSVPYVNEFLLSFDALVKSYNGLFQIDEDTNNQNDKKSYLFMERYGWIYSVKQVAEFLGIPTNEVYKIGVIEFLNVLSYLKAYNKYIAKLNGG